MWTLRRLQLHPSPVVGRISEHTRGINVLIVAASSAVAGASFSIRDRKFLLRTTANGNLCSVNWGQSTKQVHNIYKKINKHVRYFVSVYCCNKYYMKCFVE